MLLSSGDSQSTGSLRSHVAALSKEELQPPRRPMFLRDTRTTNGIQKQMSKEMQEHLSDLVFASGSASGKEPSHACSDDANNYIGHIRKLPSSQSKFAWNADRIAHELVCKFDQFTYKQEDHIRKLLWTVGTDPSFEPAYASKKNSIQVPSTGSCAKRYMTFRSSSLDQPISRPPRNTEYGTLPQNCIQNSCLF